MLFFALVFPTASVTPLLEAFPFEWDGAFGAAPVVIMYGATR
jgi:hypothetical protein